MTAPGLVQAYDKYHSRGVRFVSLTEGDAGRVRQFVEQYGIGWPCGFGVPLADLARFGVYDPSRRSRESDPATEIYPTVFLIGPDGRVLWHDGQGRPRHRVDNDTWVWELDEAIEQHLR
jgi:hypothetical protein